jgi:hypothetical protein
VYGSRRSPSDDSAVATVSARWADAPLSLRVSPGLHRATTLDVEPPELAVPWLLREIRRLVSRDGRRRYYTLVREVRVEISPSPNRRFVARFPETTDQ